MEAVECDVYVQRGQTDLLRSLRANIVGLEANQIKEEREEFVQSLEAEIKRGIAEENKLRYQRTLVEKIQSVTCLDDIEIGFGIAHASQYDFAEESPEEEKAGSESPEKNVVSSEDKSDSQESERDVHSDPEDLSTQTEQEFKEFLFVNYNLRVHEMGSDGNCLFRSISDQIYRN